MTIPVSSELVTVTNEAATALSNPLPETAFTIADSNGRRITATSSRTTAVPITMLRPVRRRAMDTATASPMSTSAASGASQVATRIVW